VSKKKKDVSADGEAHVSAPGEKLFLCAACFFAGAAILAVELAGNRLITPIFGNTLYTWTGLISVILVAIAVGDYVGGWLVDRHPNFRVLGMLFLLAGFFTLLIEPVLELLRAGLEKNIDVVSGPIWVSFVLFSIPACLLASVSPFTVRLLSRTLSDQKIGLSAGLVGMLGTLGSFLGTLATGLYLIPFAGLKAIFIGCAVIQFVIGLGALLLFGKPAGKGALAAVAVFAIGALLAVYASAPKPPYMVWEKSSFYHDIKVIDEPYRDGKTARLLKLDTTHEGAQELETGELLFDYQKFWKLAHVFTPNLKSALFIGGGGFGMPERLSTDFPAADITVAEIDPAVIETGHKYFRLDQFPKVKVVASDGRRFLTQSDKRYDMIFGDAYSGVQSVPAHLTTREFFTQISNHLEDNGVYMMNLIGAIQGNQSTYFRAINTTLRSVFPQVIAFGVQNPFSNDIQNIVFVAFKHPITMPDTSTIASEEIRGLLQNRIEPVLLEGKGILITDDRNPAEHFVALQVGGDHR